VGLYTVLKYSSTELWKYLVVVLKCCLYSRIFLLVVEGYKVPDGSTIVLETLHWYSDTRIVMRVAEEGEAVKRRASALQHYKLLFRDLLRPFSLIGIGSSFYQNQSIASQYQLSDIRPVNSFATNEQDEESSR
jgi:hypothetical protein